MEKCIRTEIHDMSEKIYELQEKTEHLTNGQRYAAINEINKSIAPLKRDLHKLEHNLYSQNSDTEYIIKQMDKILNQIDELENIKSDLTTRINTETEHTRQELNQKIITTIQKNIQPLAETIQENQQDIRDLNKSLQENKNEIAELKINLIQAEKDREIKDTARFDRFKWVLTAVVAIFSALSFLSVYLEPSIHILTQVLFGT